MTAEEQYTKARDKEELIEAMIEFAKYHVEKALEAASNEAFVDSLEYDNHIVDKKF